MSAPATLSDLVAAALPSVEKEHEVISNMARLAATKAVEQVTPSSPQDKTRGSPVPQDTVMHDSSDDGGVGSEAYDTGGARGSATNDGASSSSDSRRKGGGKASTGSRAKRAPASPYSLAHTVPSSSPTPGGSPVSTSSTTSATGGSNNSSASSISLADLGLDESTPIPDDCRAALEQIELAARVQGEMTAALKKKRRQIKNRIAAQHSRQRKKEYIQSLEGANKGLTDELAVSRTVIYELRMQVEAQKRHIQSLEALLHKSTAGHMAAAAAGVADSGAASVSSMEVTQTSQTASMPALPMGTKASAGRTASPPPRKGSDEARVPGEQVV